MMFAQRKGVSEMIKVFASILEAVVPDQYDQWYCALRFAGGVTPQNMSSHRFIVALVFMDDVQGDEQ